MKSIQRAIRMAVPVAAVAVVTYSATIAHVLAQEKEAPVLEDLAKLDELKTLFNDDEGSPRLLLLFSPT